MANDYEVVGSIKDWRGLTIKKGQSVVYPTLSGSNVEIVEAVVIEVRRHGSHLVWRRNDAGDRVQLPTPTYSVVVRPRWSSRDIYRQWKKDVHISVVENVTVVA